MKLGQLADRLIELHEAELALTDAQRARGYGGNADTMQRKLEALCDAEHDLARLRDEEINLSTSNAGALGSSEFPSTRYSQRHGRIARSPVSLTADHNIHPSVMEAFDTIDASVFSSDTFMTQGGREVLREFLARWNRWDTESCYYAKDGTLLNADGTRSIFDDVDK